jgi:tetratricopeptide (TPR) repeat protein
MFGRTVKCVIVAVLFVLTGCQSAPEIKKPVHVEPVKKKVEEPIFVAEAGLSNQQRLSKSISQMELGNPGQAQAELEAYLVDIPDSKIANLLLRQITAPISELFPDEYQEIELQDGETISTIAKNYLGDALQFYSLARYNNFAEPGKLGVGQLVRVPLTANATEFIASQKEQKSEPPELDSAEQAPVGEIPSEIPEGLVTIDEQEFALSRIELLTVLLVDGQHEELFSEFEKIGETDGLDNKFVAGLAEAYSDSANGLRLTDEKLAGSRYLASAKLLLAIGDRKGAVEILQSSLQLNPGDIEAQELFSTTSAKLIDEYHSEASHAYRRQELDTAIGLWEWILSIDPNHEHALDYLVRAQELKNKMDKFR